MPGGDEGGHGGLPYDLVPHGLQMVAEVAADDELVVAPGGAPGVGGEAGEGEGGEIDEGGVAVDDLLGEGLADRGSPF